MKSVVLLLILHNVYCFVPCPSITNRYSLLLKSGGKGFGAPKPSKKKVEKKQEENELPPIVKNTAPKAKAKPYVDDISAGQSALKSMRRKEAERKDDGLRKLKELREMDQSVIEDGAPVIPERVAMRMGQRMLPFVGIPLFLGTGSFVTFWYLATYKDMEFQPVSVAAITIVLLAVSLVGITYSLFSTSWDEERDGSFLGVDEAQRNLGNVKEGLVRTSENAEIRDKLDRMSENEIERQLDGLDRRDADRQKETID